jgi:ABC-type nitrate/sulfonate/bicarbonate transport system substrate-binding protein
MSSSKSMRLAALAAVGSLAFAACGSTSSAPPSAATTAAPTTAATAGPTAEPGALPAPELTSIKIGLSVTEMSEFAPTFADKLGLFAKYGITNVELSTFEGDAKVMGALQAGQIDIGFNGTSSVVSSQLTDAPAVAVGVEAVILTDDLVCQAGIDSAEKVRGKTVAISSFGGTSNGSALLSLKALNLGATDAVMTIVGGQSTRLAALTAGSVDCAVVDANLESDMIAQGFSIAAKLKDSGISWGRAGMDVLKEWAAKNPNTLLVVLAAVVEGQNAIWTSTDAAAVAYAAFTGLDADKAMAQVLDFQDIGNRSMTWTDEAFNNPRKVLAAINPDVVDVDVTTVFDRGPINSLITGGFFDKIGSPIPNPIPGS